MSEKYKKLWVPTTVLEKIVMESVSVNELAEMMGVSPNTLQGYIRQGECPKYVDMCCEVILRRLGNDSDRFGLIKVSRSDDDMVHKLLNKLGVSIKWME